MLGWVSGRLRCAKGRHERSEKHVHRVEGDEGYVSKCRFCGTPMKRLAKRNWIPITRREFRQQLGR